MTDTQQQAGIRNRIYIAGKLFVRDPVPVNIAPRRFEAKNMTSNLSVKVDRAFVISGQPNILNRHDVVTPWPDLREGELLEHVDVVCAVGQPFDVCVWKQVYDVFDGDGTRKIFYLQRRMALTNISSFVPFTFPDWETQIVVYDKSLLDPTATGTSLTVVSKTSATIDSGTPSSGEAWVEDDGEQQGSLWLTKIRLGDAPGNFNDVLRASYIPLYRMVVDQEAPRSYAERLREPRSLKLAEVG
jgi:hypothetical protein